MSGRRARRRSRDDDGGLPVPEELKGSCGVLRRGVQREPRAPQGPGLHVVVSLGVTVVSLVTPVLVQQIFDNGFDGGFRPTFVYGICAAAFLLVVVAFLAARAAGERLVRASEEALMNLRVRTFAHIHRPLDRRAVRREARRVRGARDRRRRLAAAVHRVGRDRVDHLVRAGRSGRWR